jgi:acyl-CoA reductase-like NAD-dependent aldehyde dehydrogenase
MTATDAASAPAPPAQSGPAQSLPGHTPVNADALHTDRLYIDGAWRAPHAAGSIVVHNPATELAIGSVPAADEADVDAAVRAAAAALPGWLGTDPAHRAELCARIGELLAERAEELAALISAEVGAPIAFARGFHTEASIERFLQMPEQAASIEFAHADGGSLILREGVGVVAAITPWNYPMLQIAEKVAPALAAGCTVVLKPSEVTPLCAYLLADCIDAAGLPPGVFNLISGHGPSAGEALVAHPLVDMVSFTGSTRAGRRISEVAAARVKRTAMELGGKSPNVILDDIRGERLAEVVAAGVENCYENSGQTCSALTRMLVPRTQLADAERAAAEAARSMRMGDPADERTQLGPLVSAAQRERVLGYIRLGQQEGARLIVGGEDAVAGLPVGHYVTPTVFSDVASDMRIAQEEIFGPVLCLIPYDTEDEAIAIANGTDYGLAAGVWSADRERAIAVAMRIRSGIVQVNGGEGPPGAPFGGFKQSGHGRESGVYGLQEFLTTRTIAL